MLSGFRLIACQHFPDSGIEPDHLAICAVATILPAPHLVLPFPVLPLRLQRPKPVPIQRIESRPVIYATSNRIAFVLFGCVPAVSLSDRRLEQHMLDREIEASLASLRFWPRRNGTNTASNRSLAPKLHGVVTSQHAIDNFEHNILRSLDLSCD